MEGYNQLATIQIGPKAAKLGAAYFHLEAQQIFDENSDYIDHNAIFSDLKNTIPRSLIYSFKGEIEQLNYIQQSKIQEEKKKVNETSKHFDPLNPIESMLWEQQMSKLKKENKELNEEFNFEKEKQKLLKEQAKNSPYYQYVKESLPKTKYMHELYKTYENDFHAYSSGKPCFMSRVEERDVIEDKFRYLLEENDYLTGFQLFADCDSGFGSFTQEFLNMMEDECSKKPKILLALSDRQGILENSSSKVFQESVQSLNELLVYTELKQRCNLLIPLDVSYVNKVPFFEKSLMEKSLFNKMSALATIVSNITMPYRTKDSQGMHNIINNITPYHDLNIFNCISDIPLIKENKQLFDEKRHILLYKKNIMQHKSFMNTILFDESKPAYGESYSIRGQVQMPKNVDFNCKFDMKITDQILATPENFPPMFSQNIIKFYTPEEEDEEEEKEEINENNIFQSSKQKEKINKKDLPLNLHAFPVHSVLFCHESFKYNIKNSINLYKTGDVKAALRFQEDDFTREEIQEVLMNGEQLYDTYSMEQ